MKNIKVLFTGSEDIKSLYNHFQHKGITTILNKFYDPYVQCDVVITDDINAVKINERSGTPKFLIYWYDGSPIESFKYAGIVVAKSTYARERAKIDFEMNNIPMISPYYEYDGIFKMGKDEIESVIDGIIPETTTSFIIMAESVSDNSFMYAMQAIYETFYLEHEDFVVSFISDDNAAKSVASTMAHMYGWDKSIFATLKKSDLYRREDINMLMNVNDYFIDLDCTGNSDWLKYAVACECFPIVYSLGTNMTIVCDNFTDNESGMLCGMPYYDNDGNLMKSTSYKKFKEYFETCMKQKYCFRFEMSDGNQSENFAAIIEHKNDFAYMQDATKGVVRIVKSDE